MVAEDVGVDDAQLQGDVWVVVGVAVDGPGDGLDPGQGTPPFRGDYTLTTV
ncbi:hypothetical protein ACFFTK_29425 [Pseudonocardia petroleophila]|uniref:Uncharacterized protein n=1 Tax=Pseudonocardia petroleophila TaxID=37331 RepID=A0A7G7MJM8_9PSEU|nr:hypothetical protein [Pseudonocardia petroleophila]QNG52989.1 hypothetical protein H6H00_02790 [Pseudonocardia petroleophila]